MYHPFAGALEVVAHNRDRHVGRQAEPPCCRHPIRASAIAGHVFPFHRWAFLCCDLQYGTLDKESKGPYSLFMTSARKSADKPAGRLVGYARVSTDEQDLRAQEAALLRAGVMPVNFYSDKKSGSTLKRKGLDEALLDCRPGDVLVVTALDRLSRSVEDLIYLSNRLRSEGVELRSLRESIDTTSPLGVFFFHLMAALAQFERSLIGRRTRDGMAAAKERGEQMGRKPTLTGTKYRRAVEMLKRGMPAEQVARRIGMSGPRLRQKVLEVEGKPLWQTKPRKK